MAQGRGWESLLAELAASGATVATAESLTGGRLAAALTEVPGSSEVYAGGVVCYATAVKVATLGVPEEVVEKYGVVSAECARAMAAGVRRLIGTTYALATTGVAGPGEQEGKPVGTVYVAVAGPDGVATNALSLAGDRSEIQAASVEAAVSALADIMGVPEPGTP